MGGQCPATPCWWDAWGPGPLASPSPLNLALCNLRNLASPHRATPACGKSFVPPDVYSLRRISCQQLEQIVVRSDHCDASRSFYDYTARSSSVVAGKWQGHLLSPKFCAAGKLSIFCRKMFVHNAKSGV